ncbi:GNAT family N-acetyltransferase [Nocardioides perillae]|uniref:GNAT superfamily N-acetyltransferase n=1 Tax=Nocardioides perillae TaxID=1119534 RepID=A0A7Y9RV01_9ACTN|nr:GNAT family N-acetyltransferase [Nocardioides perillae]NYG56815.1 GNAT superfamily N-acetyltransferase [Nocardioides perillae]
MADQPAPGAVRVRRATPADRDAIRRVGHAAWPATYAFAGEAYVRDGLERLWSVEAVEESLAQTTYVVAEVADEQGWLVVGTGNVDLAPEVPVIWRLYVRPDHQADGLGGQVLQALLAVVPPGRRVRLEYVDGNLRAATFYARHGFREAAREPGRREGWPDSVWMEREV